jgi:hypothetical protein
MQKLIETKLMHGMQEVIGSTPLSSTQQIQWF